jgi:carboxyl-terminal processing protease
MLKFSLFFFVLFTLTISHSQVESKLSTTQKFDEVLHYVNMMYVDTVNDKKLTETAIVALLEELDPHSTYISKEEVDEANSSINGNFVGIGIRFQILKDTLMVVATIPGGPSEKLGILPGDKIVKIENENVAGVGLKNGQVRERLMGDLGSKVKIEIIRRNSKRTLEFIITRDKIPINSIDAHYMISNEIGYIKLSSFSRSTAEEIANSIKELKLKGMKTLILDLQGNGGGLLDAAQKVADEFLSENKLIVYSVGRSQPRQNLQAYRKGLWEEGNLIILTDEYAASASEIVSGAIQDWDRGMIIGRRTFGKGLVQRPIDLSDGSQIRLTIARYYTPTGRWIQKPYDDPIAYKKDLTQRYLNGEFSHADSIKLPDSLKFETLSNKRIVYGGGGIMPDVFVPIDTTEITDYFRDLVQKGHINSFCLEYVDKNRKDILSKYPSFDYFATNFKIGTTFMDEFFQYIQKEDPTIEFNEEQYKTSESLIKIRLKSLIAQDIWGYNEFYQIYNQSNEILQKAIEISQKDEINNYLKR